MQLRKSTRVWLATFASGVAVAAVASSLGRESGCFSGIGIAAAAAACLVLLFRATVVLFRAVVRRLTLRLAFSYFLIGLVPIPLLGLLAFVAAYLVGHQFMATRVREGASAVARESILSGDDPRIRTALVRSGKVVRTDASWLPVGAEAAWQRAVETPRPVRADRDVWLALARPAGDSLEVRLVPLTAGARLQEIADRTGYTLSLETGRARGRRGGYEVDFGTTEKPARTRARGETVRPRHQPAPGPGDDFLHRDWVGAVYVEPALAAFEVPDPSEQIVLFLARASPATLFRQLFAQGVPEIGTVFWAVTAGLAATLLFVYLIALATAFVLVGTIARNVNRLTRATRAIARGDFSVRVNSKSRDQIGDLARSFDSMADSIQTLLVQTAEKQRLEGEIQAARTIQQRLLPPAEATLPGVSLLAHFQPVAEIGGDYYDYLSMPDGRSAVAVGDVSGHGLPTGLLVATAKAALTTLVETGVDAAPLFTRLNHVIHRATDSRNYMTLAFFAYDEKRREGTLTNAGQLAPYRVSHGEIEALSLPSFPLRVSASRLDFPTRSYSFAPGDRLVFVTDGFVEAGGFDGEPFGFERLEALLRAHAATDAPRLRDALLSAISSHTVGAGPDDDRTLVILTIG